jgi:ABC-2 type transport system permease protein
VSSPAGPGGLADAIAAEWLKLRSSRSTWYTLAVLAAAVLASEAVTLYAVSVWDHATAAHQATFSVTPADQLTGYVGELLLGVLGVLVITPEYTTGLIRLTLTAVPHRARLLAAKAAVTAAATLAAIAVSLTVSFLAARLTVGRRPIPFDTGPLAHEIPMMAALTATGVITALTGLGLGTVMRSTAGAIAALAGLWYVLPALIHVLPDPWNTWLSFVTLAALPAELAGAPPFGPDGPRALLSPPAAAAALAAYAVLALAAAAIVITRRDAG